MYSNVLRDSCEIIQERSQSVEFYSACILLSFYAYDKSYSESRTEMTFISRWLVKTFHAPADYFSSHEFYHWGFLKNTVQKSRLVLVNSILKL